MAASGDAQRPQVMTVLDSRAERVERSQRLPRAVYGARPGWLPRITIEHLWLSLPILLVVWFGFLTPLRLLDFWWHLKAGEVIAETWSIPRVEMFSFTSAG